MRNLVLMPPQPNLNHATGREVVDLEHKLLVRTQA